MKKQILILTFFIAAIFASATKSFGQDTTLYGSAPNFIDTLNCATEDLPLHPMPGIPYTYRMNGLTGQELVDQLDGWTWFATKDTSFITATAGLDTTDMLYARSGELISATTGVYGQFNQSADSVTITWSPAILAATNYTADPAGWRTADAANPTPTFVVGYGQGEECADNIQVYSINPQPAFTIDIANIDPVNGRLDWNESDSSCVSPIYSASYRFLGGGTADSIYIDYGVDTIYFEVSARNFVTSFTPRFTVFGNSIRGSQTATVDMFQTMADATAGTNVIDSHTFNANTATDSTDFHALTANNIDSVAIGVSVFFRVIIDNNSYESLTYGDFHVAIDAVDDSGQWDMEDDDCGVGTASNWADDYDQVTHVITPRPTIIADPDFGATTTSDPDSNDPENEVGKIGNGN